MINKDVADLTVLLLTLIATPVYCYSLYRNSLFSLKKGFLLLLVFLAMYPLMNMLAHIIAVSTLHYLSGTFHYDFRFYSLILYGVVFVLINGYTLAGIRTLSRGDWRVYKPMVRINLLQVILILPSFPLNPLALLPAMTSLVLIVRLVVAKRKSLNRQVVEVFTKPHAELA